MKKRFWEKRIPTLAGLLFLALSVGTFLWFGKYVTEFRGRASSEETPKNVKIANITDNSFTVAYTTDLKTTGLIHYGLEGDSGPVAFDERDKDAGKPEEYQVHFVTITGLEQATRYYFTIQSGANTFLDNGKPYEVTTAIQNSELPSGTRYTVSGTVNLSDGSIPLEGIATVTAASTAGTRLSQLVAGFLKPDGSYVIDLGRMRSEDLATYFQLDAQSKLELNIFNNNAKSKVFLLAPQANPVPLVTLSKDYDFTSGVMHVINDGSATQSAELTQVSSPSAFPVFDTTAASGLEILTPAENEKFTDQQPLFQGTALPNEPVAITIESESAIKTTVQSDDLGNWQFRPADPLKSGEHFITIAANDIYGLPQTIKRGFTVYAQGSQFTEPSVSPSAAVSPTASVSATATVIPSPTQTLNPTANLTQEYSLTQAYGITQAYSLTQAASIPATLGPDSLTLTAAAKNSGNNIAPAGNLSLLFAGATVALFITAGFVLFFF